jgi:hypothetical protein
MTPRAKTPRPSATLPAEFARRATPTSVAVDARVPPRTPRASRRAPPPGIAWTAPRPTRARATAIRAPCASSRPTRADATRRAIADQGSIATTTSLLRVGAYSDAVSRTGRTTAQPGLAAMCEVAALAIAYLAIARSTRIAAQPTRVAFVRTRAAWMVVAVRAATGAKHRSSVRR